MHYVFTMETVWKFPICRISGCRYKSGNGFNGEKVRVEGTNRMQARVQGRGPGLPQGNLKTTVLWGGDHPQKPASSLEDGILDGTARACECVCVWTHACAWAEKEREKKGERGGRGEGKALLPFEIFF